MPSSAVSPVPQGLALHGRSPMHVACVLLLSLGLFFLQSNCMQRLSSSHCGQCLVPSRGGTPFNKVHGGLLVKCDLPPPPPDQN